MTKPDKNTPEHQLAVRTRRGFLTLGAGAVAAVAGWTWLLTRPEEDALPGPFRRMLGWNRKITNGLLFSDSHHAPEYEASRAMPIKKNGEIGLDDDLDMSSWELEVTPYNSQAKTELKMDDIYKLPRSEHTTEFKCIEGWSTIVHCAGTRLSDFTARYAAGSERARYVGLETPDKEYFVGLDMPSALHPQTLLCYEMNGKPLEDAHGAPLRLIVPVKYGIKSLKRIGQITYSDEPPADYWAQSGYDYYAGL